jgi:DNA-binding HxlR family transcriptional regulator
MMRAFATVFKDSASARMMDVLFEMWDSEISKSDLARAAGISRDSIYRILPDWESMGIVKRTRQVGVTKLYSLNKENGAVIALKNFGSSVSAEGSVKRVEKTGATVGFDPNRIEKEKIVETAPDRLRMIKMKTDSLLLSTASRDKPEDENVAQIKTLFERGAISRRTYEELLKNLRK